jgi:hypothetical protein
MSPVQGSRLSQDIIDSGGIFCFTCYKIRCVDTENRDNFLNVANRAEDQIRQDCGNSQYGGLSHAYVLPNAAIIAPIQQSTIAVIKLLRLQLSGVAREPFTPA